MKYFVDFNKPQDASTIMWISESVKINDTEPFIDFIRCDFDGEEYKYLYSDEEIFKQIAINNFAAINGDEEDTFYLCYTADLDIDLEKFPDFKKALSFSNNLVEVVLGFKHNGKILEDCFEEHENRQSELSVTE